MLITELSIRRPLLVLMVLLFFVVLGAVAYTRLGVEQYPKAEFPFVMVVTAYPGASPDDVESDVTGKVEDAVAGVGDLKNLYSFSMEGLSVVALEFRLGADQDRVAIDVERLVNTIRSELPTEVEAPNVMKTDFNALPIMLVSLSGEGAGEQLRELAEDRVKTRLQAVRGVASVAAVGGREREILVKVDQSKLQARGLTIQQVYAALGLGNVSIPGGSVDEEGRRYNVRYRTVLEEPEDLRDIVVSAGPTGTVYLTDVAEVVDGFKTQETINRTNGVDSVGLLVTRTSNANIVEVAGQLRKTLAEAAQTLPAGVKLDLVSDSSEYVRQSIDDIQESLRDAVILTGLVLLLFLHSFRSTLIVLLAIPTSLISTFLVMWALGFTMNTMSMLAMVLSIGILVDDSIVVLENIFRHLNLGETPWTAALKGRSEIGSAAIAITLVDVVVYVPVAFTSGIVGQFFREFGLTVATATLLSLAVSFTLTPMLASRWLRAGADGDRHSPLARLGHLWDAGYERLTLAYRGMLIWGLAHRMMVLAVATIALFGSMALIPLGLIGIEFLPSEDQAEVNLLVETPPGTSLRATDEVVLQLEARLAAMPEVETYFSTVGSGGSTTLGGAGFSFSQNRFARITVKLAEKNRRSKSITQMATELQRLGDDIPGLTLQTRVPVMGMNHGQPFLVYLKGDDPAMLKELGEEIEEVVRGIPGMAQVSNSAGEGSPEARFQGDYRRLADLGLVSSAVAMALRTNVEGLVASKLRPEGEDRVDIRVVGSDDDKQTVAGLARLPIVSPKGVVTRLGQAATLEFAESPAQIDRLNKQRVVSIGANVVGRPLGDAVSDFRREMESRPLPPGFSIAIGGEAELMEESFQTLGGAIILSVILIYMLMVALYESLLYPLVIMFALPLSLVGALLALFLAGQTLNDASMIGMIMLFGLVGKNGILLVDYTNTLRGRGKSRFEALVEAGPTRLRPILMTTGTMVFAMIPVAFVSSQGSEIRSPMALAVIGGLISSTILTLVVVPVIYTVVDDLRSSMSRKRPALTHQPSPVRIRVQES